jgi:hypothetical protein
MELDLKRVEGLVNRLKSVMDSALEPGTDVHDVVAALLAIAAAISKNMPCEHGKEDAFFDLAVKIYGAIRTEDLH